MKLFADSGSTKTSWELIINNNKVKSFTTIGFNPFFVKEIQIKTELFVIEKEASLVSEIHFFGAGCSTIEKAIWLKSILQKIFINASIYIKTDIEGAVLAVSKQKEKSIISILGTGSSFRIFDGFDVIKKYSSLGYILGDEGSGTHISKKLLQKVMYHQFTKEVEASFYSYFKTCREEIIENIYSKPLPNRFLAKFTIFCNLHIQTKEIEEIIMESFDDYFTQHILNINNHSTYKLHFVGSIAFHFQSQLKKVAKKHNLQIGQIVQKPISNIIKNSTV